MASKTMKTILFASLIAALIVPISGSIYAQAQSAENILPEMSSIPGVTQATYDEMYDLTMEKLDLRNQGETLKQEYMDSNGNVSAKTLQSIEAINDRLNAITAEQKLVAGESKKTQNDLALKSAKIAHDKILNSDIPWVTMGIDDNIKGLRIQIAEDDGTDYDSQIRELIGNTSYRIEYNPDGWDADSCNNQTDNCNPLLGGIRMYGQATSTTVKDCTISIHADRNVYWWTESGFVTAAHCITNGSYNDVWQPTDSYGKIGDGVLDVLGGTCDCGWFKKTSSDSSPDKIWSGYASSVTITDREEPADDDWVLMIGKSSGIKLGQITSLSESGVIDGVTVTDAMYISGFASVDGDSGAPVIDNVNFDTYHGLVAAHVGTNTTVLIPYDNIDSGLNLVE